MRKSTIFFIFFLLLLLIIAGFFTYNIVKNGKTEVSEETKQIFSDESEDFYYTDINGNEISLEQYLGRVLVVMSWASWSPYSANDLKQLNELAGNYDESDVIFMAINRKENKEMAERFLNTIPNPDNLLLVLDPTDNFYKAVAGYAMPETVIFDEQGEISLHVKGVADTADIKSNIELILSSSE